MKNIHFEIIQIKKNNSFILCVFDIIYIFFFDQLDERRADKPIHLYKHHEFNLMIWSFVNNNFSILFCFPLSFIDDIHKTCKIMPSPLYFIFRLWWKAVDKWLKKYRQQTIRKWKREKVKVKIKHFRYFHADINELKNENEQMKKKRWNMQ